MINVSAPIGTNITVQSPAVVAPATVDPVIAFCEAEAKARDDYNNHQGEFTENADYLKVEETWEKADSLFLHTQATTIKGVMLQLDNVARMHSDIEHFVTIIAALETFAVNETGVASEERLDAIIRAAKTTGLSVDLLHGMTKGLGQHAFDTVIANILDEEENKYWKETKQQRGMIKNAAKTIVEAVAGASLAIPAIATPISPDAKLIALYADLLRQWKITDAANDLNRSKGLNGDERQEKWDIEYDKVKALEQQILQIPAQTMDGVQAKLWVYVKQEGFEYLGHSHSAHNFFAKSAFEDIKRFAPIDIPAA